MLAITIDAGRPTEAITLVGHPSAEQPGRHWSGHPFAAAGSARTPDHLPVYAGRSRRDPLRTRRQLKEPTGTEMQTTVSPLTVSQRRNRNTRIQLSLDFSRDPQAGR